MTKDELVEKLQDMPGDYEVMLDAEGFTPIQSIGLDDAAGTIVIEGV